MFKKLFEPGKIGNVTIRNRIVMPAMQTRGADEQGFITEHLIDYYAERAKGGAGLLVVQMSAAWPEAKLRRGIALYDDRYIPRLQKLAETVQSHGARVAVQMGGRGNLHQHEGLEPVGPSIIGNSWGERETRALTSREISEYREAFIGAALRVKKAGFDAVEINCAHGHLLSMFLSPYTNQRQDEYGGSLKNRMRLTVEILTGIKSLLGRDFPVIIRINGDDFIENGITIKDAVSQARIFAENGADAISVSGSCHETIYHSLPHYLSPSGYLAHLSPPIKKEVNIPVIIAGKINHPALAEQILGAEKSDFVAMGRALIADPELPNKASAQKVDDIRRCLYCGNCLTWEVRSRLSNRGISCTVNPAVLREAEFRVKLASKIKDVMVIGGGLAGMEAARVLAERGHRVCLYERNSHLGGQWSVAACPEYKSDYKTLLSYLSGALLKSGARVFLNTEVTPMFIETKKPDAIVLATGAAPRELDVPAPAKGGPDIVQANNVIIDKAKVGKRVVVVGGRYLGMEVAAALARQGRHVSIVEALELGHFTQPLLKAMLRNQLVESGVYVYPHSPVVRITSTGVAVVNNGSLLHLEADTLVLAVGTEPVNNLAKEIEYLGIETHVIGDCRSVRDAMEAINDGNEVGRSI